MKALILAGGLGKRLALKDIPKPMYKLNGKPILEHNILLLKKYNIKEICIALHYMPEAIKNYFKDGNEWEVKITYSLEKKPLGTAGAIKNAEWFFNKEPILVLYGDNYVGINFHKMLDFHKTKKSLATIALFDPQKSLNSDIAGGVVSIDEDNNLLSFTEGKGNKINGYVNAGVYILEPKILDMIPPEIPSDFGKDIFPKLLKEGFQLKGYLTDSFVLAIDTKDALELTEKKLRQGILSNDND